MERSWHPFVPRPGCDGVVVRFADKRWYLRHWHSHEWLEMNLVVRGTGSVMLEDRKYPLLPGHLIWLWPGQKHVPVDWSSDMLMWIVEWRHDYLRVLRRERGKGDLRPAQDNVFWCRHVDDLALRHLQGLLASVDRMHEADSFNLGMHLALLALWDEFVRAPCVANEEFLHPKLEQVMGLLNDPSNEMSLRQLAGAVKLSPYYLSNLFRKETGMTIPAFRNRRRLSEFFGLYHAKPHLRLLELALEAGFGSYAQFYRVFTHAVGRTPQKWITDTQE